MESPDLERQLYAAGFPAGHADNAALGATVAAPVSVAPGGGNFTQLFNLGLTTVTYLATDNNGKTSSCQFLPLMYLITSAKRRF